MKKFLLAALLVPVTSFAFEATDPLLVRVLDGNNVQCRDTWEVGKVTYNPTLNSISVSDDGQLAAGFHLDFVSCVARGDKLGLEPRLPLAPREYLDMDGTPIRIEYRSPEFMMAAENFSETSVVSLEDRASQGFSARIALDKVLTPEQRGQLEQGQPVRARLALLSRRVATMIKRGESTPLGTQFLGSFTLFVTIRR